MYVGSKNHALDGVYSGATWRIQLSDPRAAAMRPCVRDYFDRPFTFRTKWRTKGREREKYATYEFSVGVWSGRQDVFVDERQVGVIEH